MRTLNAKLFQLKKSNTVIQMVYVANTQEIDGSPDLAGVTIKEIGSNYVVFTPAGASGQANEMLVCTDQILSIEL
ncbi:hypothetical protein [Guptibacillus algicola]|uniref:hypothetical protein n=1 Tax=Guptibacillus algicola TaxID=225844 RepID=UPI001CD35FE8|nr:hypothetical protein [Alkalihalobacillus algicola]MCA0987850.1 hypothetical protein [Alkalihalobacillus algicola]